MITSICQENRHIWSFDCVMICSALGIALDKKKIKKLCHKYGLIPKCEKVDPSFGFYQLHRACHQERGILPVKLEKSLNALFSRVVEQVRNIDEHDTVALVGLVEKAVKESPAAILWALLTDPRDAVQHHGVYLAHRIMLAALRSYKEKNSETQDTVIALEPDSPLQLRFEQAEKKMNEFREEAKHFKKALSFAQERILELERERDSLSKRFKELEAHPSVEGKLRRELRKLRYELEQREARLIEEPQTCPEPTVKAVAMVDKAMPSDRVCEQASCCRQDAESCPLEALKVAVVGGLDRLEPHYREVVENMGAQFLFHNGGCKSGTHSLKNMVCGSDIVVFITSVNSHSALKVVKGICRKTGKSFCVMRKTSPSVLKRVLLEAVA